MAGLFNALTRAFVAGTSNTGISVSVGGNTINRFTNVKWKLSAESTEQSADFEVFMEYAPQSPVFPWIKDGVDATVSIGGFVNITGAIESRKGEGDKESYNLSFSVKSKTKKGQKQHAKLGKGQKVNTSAKKVADEIAKNGGLQIKYGASVEDVKIAQHICVGDATVDKEIKDIWRDRGFLVYGDHEGKIRVEGDEEGETGCDLIVGVNVMKYSASQSDEKKRGKIKVKGTRVLTKETNRKGTITPDGSAKMKTKIESEWVVWAMGDQTPESLKKRAKFESNRRDAASKEVEITTFGWLAPNGQPYRVNGKHYTEVPSESVYDMLRIKDISGSAKKTEVEVEVTLAPIKGLSNTLGGGQSALGKARAAIRRNQVGAKLKEGEYPSPWNETGEDVQGDENYGGE